MADVPMLSICLLTYKRTSEALETILSTCEHLKYPKSQRKWYIGDDGSDKAHVETLLSALNDHDEQILGFHNEKFEPGTYFCGKGWNKALGIAHQNSDFVLWLEDDWRMEADLELAPYMGLLQDKDNVGIVTFRILSVGAEVMTVGYDGHVFLDYQRRTQYAYSGNPYLRHARYTKHYGWFAEDRNPGLVELHQDDQYRLDIHNGPHIWRPADLDLWGAWHHIGKDKTWE